MTELQAYKAEVMKAERINGLNQDQVPSEWMGFIVFDWRKVLFIETYDPTEIDIDNGIYPTECTLIFLQDDISRVIRLSFEEASRLYKASRI